MFGVACWMMWAFESDVWFIFLCVIHNVIKWCILSNCPSQDLFANFGLSIMWLIPKPLLILGIITVLKFWLIWWNERYSVYRFGFSLSLAQPDIFYVLYSVHYLFMNVLIFIIYIYRIFYGVNLPASLVAHIVKNPPAMQETRVRSLGQEDPLEEDMATHSSILAWRLPWTEDPGGLQSMGSQRVRHDWATFICNHLY